MFAGERAFELPDQRGDLVGDLAILFQVVRMMQIQHRPDVQQARRRVAVERCLHPDALHQFLQARDIRRQILRPHRRVLDEARRLGRAFAAGEQ